MAYSEDIEDFITSDPFTTGVITPAQVATLTFNNFKGGRLMSRLPHLDGLVIATPGNALVANSANLLTTRVSNGLWTLNRTAAGVESYFVRTTFDFTRIGETYRYGTVGTTPPSAGPKGIALTNVFVNMNVGVAALTAATLRVGKTVFPAIGAAAVAPVQTDLLAATALGSLATNGAGLYASQGVTIPTPAMFTDDMGVFEIELAITMASTGTVAIAGLGAHVLFNFT
jgi:hypothetical protein